MYVCNNNVAVNNVEDEDLEDEIPEENNGKIYFFIYLIKLLYHYYLTIYIVFYYGMYTQLTYILCAYNR